MGKALDDFTAAGRKIAEQLGEGVRYAGPQTIGGIPIYHLFNDDAVTDGAFVGLTLPDSRASLIVLRMRFGAPLPQYVDAVNPVSLAEKMEEEIQRKMAEVFGKSS